MKYTMGVVALMIATTAHAGFLDDASQALGGINQILSVATNNTPPTSTQVNSNFAKITDNQMQKIVNALLQPTNNPTLDNAITQARGNIGQLLVLGGCATNFNFGAGAVQSPKAFSHSLVSAIASTNYHPKTQCLTVQNIGSWEQPTNNSLKFRVVYVSDVSGETITRNVEMIDEYGNGNWLAKKHDIY